ncbi:hypothetical protein CHGG_02213 [Chaetomium globosum CBS 148.51]|uniref:cellulase n=1 Tax=Chaetomium globosum (strain ATCC 6205 / CBS 148.51 / DSM 1962 / NBRC 6347 / NRRL 1970) TaxID=306901 RepID=Q2HC41_CHAGB|nr:uncharacterized protein CHGG_02213 [Chaetomium globosum CBS 148.51]EAQ90278.1 hypothetical protein CHGG_02213 [Chaetomium globosum CBS 148.51]
MKLLNLLLGAVATSSALAAPASVAPTLTTKEKRAGKFKFVGVNQSGAEFGKDTLPGQLGKHYTWPAKSSIDVSFVLLLCCSWERSRYYERIITDVDGFKAWWTTTAKIFSSNDKVIFDTNNEYHDMDDKLVFNLNQAAIDGIRGAGATSQLIFVEGNSWTGAWTWVSSGNGASLINLSDPAGSDKLVYEMHQYLDSDGSGTSEACVSGTIGQERLREATAWLKASGKRGILGETAGGANAQCIAALTGMLAHMAENADVWMGWLWWGGGPWWGTYMYSIRAKWGSAGWRLCAQHRWGTAQCGLCAEHMEDLYQLSLVNRRLLSVVEPILYARGIGYHFATPLAWAAKFGIAATLHKVLAAGASPDRKLRCQMTRHFWHFANDAHQATLDWAAGDPKYWPPLSNDRVEALDDEEEIWAKDMTSGLADFDVGYPAEVCPSAGLAGNGSPDSSTVDFAQSPRDPPPELYEADRLLREYTALHLAAREGHTDFVNLLLANGASVDSSSRWFCPCRPHRGLWQTMLDRPTLGHLLKPVHWLPLHAAICSSRIETAKSLLSAGATVLRNSHNGSASYGALHQAAAAGHVDLVRYILDTHPDIDVDVPDELGMTPFYHAYINARWDSTIPILMARGANINSRVRVVFDRRHGDVQTNVRLDATPLAEACRLGRFEDALKLIDLGANVTMGVQLGNDSAINMNIPPLHLCCMDFGLDNEFYPTGEAIWSRAPGQRAFRGAVIARLVAAGVSPDAKMGFIGFGVETALTVAVRHTNVAAVEALLAAGADVGIRNLKGRNALMVSVEPPTIDSPSEMSLGFLSYAPAYLASFRIAHSDAWAITKLLIEAGVSLVDGDEDGDTVLHLLFDSLDEGDRFRIESPSDMGILRLLLARGADPCLRNKKGVPALHVAVRNGRLAAVQCIAAQGRIDLVKTFPMEVVGALFDAVQFEDDIEDATTDPDWEALMGDPHRFSAATLRLIDALVDMDRSGRLSSNVSFICSRLHNRHRKDPALEVAEVLCYRGLAADTFDGEAKLTILRAAIKAARWDMARALLRDVPETDINSLDPEGHTLLSLVTSSRRMHDGGFAWELIEAGADIHIRVAPSLSCGEDTTPLKQALICSDTYPIERMLQKQPIRGNPRAIEHRYLHWAVTLPWNPSLEEEWSESVWSDRDTIVRALLVAGADPTQLDSNGDTPLLRAAREMDENKHDVCREIGHWVKPLSRGVDGHRKNKQGRSIVDHLTNIINERELSDLEFMYSVMVFNLTEDGKSVKRAIRWPPK